MAVGARGDGGCGGTAAGKGDVSTQQRVIVIAHINSIPLRPRAGESHPGQYIAVCKGMILNNRHRMRNGDFHQVGAVTKGKIFNLLDTIRDNDAAETAALSEGLTSDALEAAAQCDTRQVLAGGKSSQPNGSDAVRDCNAAQRVR